VDRAGRAIAPGDETVDETVTVRQTAASDRIDSQGAGASERPHQHRPNDEPSSDGPGAETAALVRAAAAGDQDAWNALVDKFASTVWAIARGFRLNAADAADVSQATWLRLVEHLDRIHQPDRVGAWLATTARRESLRVLRLSGRQVPAGDDGYLIADTRPTSAPDHRLLAAERDQLVVSLVEQLPARSRLLLRLLSADSPLSYRQISEVLSMPIGSIGPTRARALEQLRRLALRSGFQLDEVGT
jgi:RNA polymerase sigma factor (sigma-70 family)